MTVPQITPLPPAPSRREPATFSTRADAHVASLPGFVTEANALAVFVNDRATVADGVIDAATIINDNVAEIEAIPGQVSTVESIADAFGGIATIEAIAAGVDADRIAAEAARDAATVNAAVYASTAAAQADAGLVVGAQYQVVSGSEVIRYRKDSSSASTEVARYPAVGLVNTIFAEAVRETELFANAVQRSWANPGSLTTLTSAGAVAATGLTVINGAAQAVQVAMTLGGTSQVSGVRLDTFPLASGEVVRIEGVLLSTNTTPYFGLAFGSASAALGFGWRNTGAIATLAPPTAPVGAISTTSALPPAYAVGERVAIDARILSGSAGNWTVRYFAEKDGVRYGPYDVSGIASIDNIWTCGRGINTMSDVRLTRTKAPRFLADFWPSAGASVLYVATTGNDSNSGTSPGSPLATINAAISRAAPGAIIEVAGGEYREAVVVNGPRNLWIRASHNQRVSILGSTQLTVTKTAGYGQVYQAPLAAKPTGMGSGRGEPMLFEWGTPSKPVSAPDRHPLQRGEANRLPYAEMLEAASLAELDTVGGRGKWWWDAGTIYFAATDGGDATLKRYEARGARVPFIASTGSIRLTRIDAYFSANNGMQFRDCLSVMREDCRALGNFRNGFSDDCAAVLSFRDEAAGNGNDGVNGTPTNYLAATNRDVTASALYFDPWCHDNYDDGLSFHARGDASTFGGLYEYNRKAGLVHVIGSGCTSYHPTVRGQTNGIYAATPPDDARTETVFRVVGAMVSGCEYNYRAVDARLLVEDCRSMTASNTHYHHSGTGAIIATDCRHDGTATARAGSVTVQTLVALA